MPHYISLEQKQNGITEKELKSFIEACEDFRLERIGVTLDRTTDDFRILTNLLLKYSFEHFSSKVEVFKELVHLPIYRPSFQWQSLEDKKLSEDQFKQLWGRCMTGSDNKSSSLSMDQHLLSVRSELGDSWRKSCLVFFMNETPIGISIPHIEPGTIDEGRLFYFGLLPEARGQGLSTALHLQSLSYLREMGAAHYIGSTHLKNTKMQRVFEKNGCRVAAYTESYYRYFKKKDT